MKCLFTPVIFILCLHFFSSSSAQDISYAHDVVSKLSSPAFAGRGYVQDGNRKAAQFIIHAFDSLGITSFTPGYTQPFSFPVNTFPGKMSVTVDGINLIPGTDYLVYPPSAGANKKYGIDVMMHYASAEIFNSNPGKCHLVLPDSLPKQERIALFSDLQSGEIKSGALILLETKKLTWSIAVYRCRIPVIRVLQSAISKHPRSVTLNINEKFNPDFKTQNIAGYVKGALRPDSFIVFSAHYDHLGMMGKETYFPGANDNASGIAMLLNLAGYFSGKQNQPGCSVAFIAFAGEEAGLIGSEYYTTHPLFPLPQIKFLINLDLLGTGDEGMMVVNATEYPEQFHVLDSLNTAGHYLVKLGQRGKAKNSDHYYFTENGVPSFFFYTMGGIQAYHDVNDKAATLPLTEFEDVFRLIVEFVKTF